MPQLAGWLFADLLLVLVVVVLGGEVVAAPAHPTAKPKPTVSASASPTVRPTATSPPGLDPHTKSVTLKVDPAAVLAHSAPALADLKRQVLQGIAPYRGRHAALVLVFATAGDVNYSSQLAETVAPMLPQFAPNFFPTYHQSIIRSYFDGQGKADTIRLELFFVGQ
ncbi:hypothetical protein [Streptacidiphilus cavernicola]|uniref:Uncharacterized protein n=1 Tax=Streptacidiphilus cavernicola TaxID=3342716 RepID=A0ABV6VSR2_9ACTN